MKKALGLALCLIFALVCGNVRAQETVLGYNVTTALASSLILKPAGNGRLYSFEVQFGACASPPCFVMVFDSATVPADGAVTPAKVFTIAAANSTLVQSWVPDPIIFLNGIVIVCSTTGPFTKTATAVCFISGESQ